MLLKRKIERNKMSIEWTKQKIRHLNSQDYLKYRKEIKKFLKHFYKSNKLLKQDIIKMTEGTIKSEIYHQLRLNNIDSRVEMSLRKIHSRVDIGVLKNDELIAIIEVKNYKSNKPFNYNTRQIRKYSQLNIPVLGCCSYENISDIIKQIKILYNKSRR